MKQPAPRPQRRPNVLWIFGDQHRAQALGHRADPNVYTPNLDNLARNGLRFDAAVAGAPWCCPFRAALLTGRYPHQCGVTQTPAALDPAQPTIVAPFRTAGYHTAYIGKWHLSGSNSSAHLVPPTHRGGFDYWLGYENNNNQHEVYVHGGGDETPRRLPGYETDSLTDELLAHLRRHVGPGAASGGDYPPFFAVLAVQPPHSPYVPPHNPPYPRPPRHPASLRFRPNVPDVAWVRAQAAVDLDGYYGMIENLDWNVGRIRAELQRLGIDQDTWIVFFSDHGDMLGSHAQWEKSSPWEESIRIPFIIARLGGQERMRTGITDVPLNHVDIAPTTLGLCGIQVPDTMVGCDLSGLCWPRHHPRARRDDDPTLPDSAYLQQIPRKFHPHSVNQAWRGVVTRDGWKLACQPGHDWLLHHLVDDPYEQANLAHDSAFQPQRRRLLERLQRWIEETGDEFPLPEFDLPR
jgi:arylsulfatase A-like enzyme